MRTASLRAPRRFRILALGLLALVWAVPASSQTFQFGPRDLLNTDATTDTRLDARPRVETDGAGTWVAVWSGQPGRVGSSGYGVPNILVARSTDGGVTWSAPAPLYPGPDHDQLIDAFPSLATDRAGNWIVVWPRGEIVGARDQDLMVVRSSDNGATWTLPVPLNDDAAIDDRFDGRARITTDRAGTWVVVWTGDYEVYTARSTDLGVTWSSPAPLEVNGASDGRSGYSPVLATDGTTWVAVFEGQSGVAEPDIYTARSLDGGVTWSTSVAVNTNAGVDVEHDRDPDVATDGAGVWVAAWTTQSFVDPDFPGDGDILMARSTDGGVTWSAPAPVNTNAGIDEQTDQVPSLATDGTTWVAAWMSFDSLGGTLPINRDNILQARSTDGGVTWTAPAPINTDGYVENCEFRGYLDPQVVTDGAGVWLSVWSGLGRGCPDLPPVNDHDVFVARATTACGDGTLDAGEQCDDGALVAGDGCDPSCHVEPPPSVCGNGVHEFDEECDDGNAAFDDGCDPTCQVDPPPVLCGNGVIDPGEVCDDGNTSNFDACDATCQYPFPPPPSLCGNGVLNAGEECDDGNLTPDDGCDAVCNLEPCGFSPDPSCGAPLAGKSSLKIKRDVATPAKNRLDWKWRGADAIGVFDFGSPLFETDFNVCVYVAGDLVSTTHIPGGGLCGGRRCWKPRAKGPVFQDKTLAHDGASLLALAPGDPGQAQLRFTGRGATFAMPALPAGGAVHVQLRRANDPFCWGARFSAPFQRNDAGGLTAKSD